MKKDQLAVKNRLAIDMLREKFGGQETLSLELIGKLISILDGAEAKLERTDAVAFFEALVEADIRFVSVLARTRLKQLCPPVTRPVTNDSAYQKLVIDRADVWLPACGGTEVPFKSRSGRELLYCYNPKLGKHAYLDCGTDTILTDDEAARALELF